MSLNGSPGPNDGVPQSVKKKTVTFKIQHLIDDPLIILGNN